MTKKYKDITEAANSIKKEMRKAVDNNGPLWKEIGNTVVQNIRSSQVQGKGADSDTSGLKKFAPLAPKTKQSRARKSLSSLTNARKSNLIETGQMHKDLDSKATKDSVTIKHRTARSSEIAYYHEFGDGVPQRSFMNLGKINIQTVKNIFLKYLDKIIK